MLYERYQSLGEAIVGKSFLLASYGSGNTMVVLSGRIAADAPAVLRNWDLQALLDAGKLSTMKEYLRWSSGPYEGNVYNSLLQNSTIPAKSFYLSGIREDGYREYKFNTEEVQPQYREFAESEASGGLYQPITIRG
jgi:hydroxymethylglutaryl-CoA synthase